MCFYNGLKLTYMRSLAPHLSYPRHLYILLKLKNEVSYKHSKVRYLLFQNRLSLTYSSLPLRVPTSSFIPILFVILLHICENNVKHAQDNQEPVTITFTLLFLLSGVLYGFMIKVDCTKV